MHVNTCKYRNFRSSSLIQFGELHASFNLSRFPSISAKSKIMVYMLSSIDLSNSVWWKVAVHPDWKMHPETGDLSLVCDCSCWRSWQASQTPRCVMVRAAAIRVEGGDREKEIEMVVFISPPPKKWQDPAYRVIYHILVFFSKLKWPSWMLMFTNFYYPGTPRGWRHDLPWTQALSEKCLASWAFSWWRLLLWLVTWRTPAICQSFPAFVMEKIEVYLSLITELWTTYLKISAFNSGVVKWFWCLMIFVTCTARLDHNFWWQARRSQWFIGWEILTSPRSERREGHSTIVWPISNHWHSYGLSHPFWVFGIMLDNSLLPPCILYHGSQHPAIIFVGVLFPAISRGFFVMPGKPALKRVHSSQLRWLLVLPWFQSSWCSPLCLPQRPFFTAKLSMIFFESIHWGYGPEQGDSVGEFPTNEVTLKTSFPWQFILRVSFESIKA